MDSTARKWIGTWLLIGCVMVFFQVMVGGVTRLTESGLSITEWKPIKGIVPPTNEQEWNAEFERYKTIAQYQTINQGMLLSEFKWIYFWEYFHRFWARFMGFVFAIPFAFFLYRKWFTKDLMQKTIPLFVWGGVIGVYGWIMVRSGLRGMYVPPIHLSIHLLLAMSLFGYLVWLTTYVWLGVSATTAISKYKNLLWVMLVLLFVQVFFGGIVSGMKAGLAANDWPLINGQLIPDTLWQLSPNSSGFTQYNAQDFWGRIFIQFVHRSTAYIIVGLVFFFWWKNGNAVTSSTGKLGINLLPLTVCLQAIIGIFTVVNCVGHIPVFYGVLHQVGAMLLIANMVFVLFHMQQKSTLAV